MAGAAEGAGAVDFSYLEGFCAGDQQVITDVLITFREQAAGWAEQLAGTVADQRELAHTIKGSALGIGAKRLGEAASAAEFGGPADLEPVRTELADAIAELEGYLTRIGGG